MIPQNSLFTSMAVLRGSASKSGNLLPADESDSSFFRLLSGQLSLDRTGRNLTGNERSNPASDPENRSADRVGVGTRQAEPEGAPTGDGQEHLPSGANQPASVGPVFGPAGWNGLWGLLPQSEPLVLVTSHVGGAVPTGGMPAEMLAQFTAEIAAGYTENNGIQNLTLNLQPEHLGRLEVRLQARGDHLSVRLTAANPAAENALKDNLRDLTEAIQARAGRFQHLDVRVELRDTQDYQKESPDQERGFQGQGQNGDQRPGRDRGPESEGPSDPQEEPESGLRTQGG